MDPIEELKRHQRAHSPINLDNYRKDSDQISRYGSKNKSPMRNMKQNESNYGGQNQFDYKGQESFSSPFSKSFVHDQQAPQYPPKSSNHQSFIINTDPIHKAYEHNDFYLKSEKSARLLTNESEKDPFNRKSQPQIAAPFGNQFGHNISISNNNQGSNNNGLNGGNNGSNGSSNNIHANSIGNSMGNTMNFGNVNHGSNLMGSTSNTNNNSHNNSTYLPNVDKSGYSNNSLNLSALNSGGTFANNGGSYCKNCKRHEENEKVLLIALNEILNMLNDVVDKEKLWRQGKINFEFDNVGWDNFNDEDIFNSSEMKTLKQFDLGKMILDMKKQFYSVRRMIGDMIIDIENLSKTPLYNDIELKENSIPSPALLNNQEMNPGAKLINALQDAKNCLDSMKMTVLSDEVPEYIMKQIGNKSKKDLQEKNIAKTLLLQLEHSRRERRLLEIEVNLYKKGDRLAIDINL